MDSETDELRRAVGRYRFLLRATADEKATAALNSLIEEAQARLRALDSDEEEPGNRFE